MLDTSFLFDDAPIKKIIALTNTFTELDYQQKRTLKSQ